MSAPAAAVRPRSTRDSILDAAERVFAERGFDGVSMREITAAVGLKNQGSLYHHFRDKHALYEAVLTRGVEALIAVVAKRLAGEPPRPTARSFAMDPVVEHLLDYLAEHPNLPRLIQRTGLDDSPEVRGTATRLLSPLYRQGLEVLTRANHGRDAAELPHLAAGLYHLIFGYFASAPLLEAVAGTDPHAPGAVARQRRFVKDALARLLAPRAPGSPRGARTP